MKNDMKKIADFYSKSEDQVDLIDDMTRTYMRKFASILFDVFKHSVEFRFVDYMPYSYTTLDEVMEDFNQGFIRVPTLGDDSIIFGKENLKFRATHDYIHVLLKKDFSFQDEVDTWSYTKDLFHISAPYLDKSIIDRVAAILRSEIVYQSAYKNVFDEEIINQKVILDDYADS